MVLAMWMSLVIETCFHLWKKRVSTMDAISGISVTVQVSVGRKNGLTEHGQVKKAEWSLFLGQRLAETCLLLRISLGKRLRQKIHPFTYAVGREQLMEHLITLFLRALSLNVIKERTVALTLSS